MVSPRCIVPLTVGEPVVVVPGLIPRFPLTVVAPVLVTVVAAKTANLAAEPREGIVWTAMASCRGNITTAARPAISAKVFKVFSFADSFVIMNFWFFIGD